MKSAHVLGLLVAAGAFGAVAGGLVGSFSAPGDTGPDPVVTERLAEIARGVESLRDSASDARNDIADVRERLVAVELELSRRAAAGTPVASRPDADGEINATPGAIQSGADVDELRRALTGRAADLTARMVDMEAAASEASATQARFAKGMKIRAMPEDERWEYAAETLGLNTVQVGEIRAAHADLQEGLKAAVVEENTESDGRAITFRRVDGNKMREAQSTFQARVDNALNDEQKKAWADEGFVHAMGRSRGTMWVSPRRMRAVDVDTDGRGTGSGTIEIVTTETLEGGKSE